MSKKTIKEEPMYTEIPVHIHRAPDMDEGDKALKRERLEYQKKHQKPWYL